MVTRLIAALALCVAVAVAAKAQPASRIGEPLVMGEMHQIASNVLGENRRTVVRLPTGRRARAPLRCRLRH